MILSSIKLYAYSIPLLKDLMLQGKSINQRDGFIIEIKSDNGITSYSEIAPLPNFSKESLEDVIAELIKFAHKFCNQSVPPDILTQLSKYLPSVRFGIESALLSLTAKSKDLTLIELLNPNANQVVHLNALLVGTIDEIEQSANQHFQNGYKAFKIKVGRLDANEEIKIIEKVRKIVGDDSLIRLDANRRFDFDSVVEFYERVKQFNIDYIEEPFLSFDILQKYLKINQHDIPIALDESLQEIIPEDLNDLIALKAIILKPTLLGYTHSMMFAKKAFALGIQPVISSSFETSIGLYVLASMGAIIDSKIPIGLDTLSWFKDDIITKKLELQNGKIDIKSYKNFETHLDFSKLTEVSLDNI